MHELSGGLVLGYHGCDRKVGEALLAGEPFHTSENVWDWLGHGIYFWEANPRRGYEFAETLRNQADKRNKVKEPFVVGVAAQLGLCLDLTTSAGVDQVRIAYEGMSAVYAAQGRDLPANHPDLLRRNLDCAVIEFIHAVRDSEQARPVDSIRGIFVEGGPVFPTSGFYDRTHVQIAIRNPDCIKGVFRVANALYE